MQFVLIAHDYKDEGLKRRLEVREEHIHLGDQMRAAGNFLYGVATLSETGEMTGSVAVFDFPSRAELDEYLKIEPYVTNKVWEKIQIFPCAVGPTFTKLTE